MIKKCLFPAAGYGTRFLPATKAIPKEMLPILTKPLLQFGVEEAISANINHMSIVDYPFDNLCGQLFYTKELVGS